MFVVEDRGLILDTAAQPPSGRIAFFTALCRLQSGTWLCAFQNGPAKHAATSTVRLCRSTDQGQHWELLPPALPTQVAGRPGSLGAAELLETQPGRLLLAATWFDRSDPQRPLFDPVTQGILRSRQLLAESVDEGRTWTAWRELSVGGLKGTALTGPLLHWPDGTLGVAFESYKEFDDPQPGQHAAWLVVSRDHGASFSEPLLVAQHPEHRVYYWDQRLCPGPRPGEFTALFWTHDLVQQRDLPVHLCHATLQPAGIRHSGIHATTLPGQIAAPLWLNSRQLAAFVVDRGQPGTLTLWCSPDRGQTWPESTRLIVHTHDEHAAVTQGREHIDFRQYWEDMGKWSFGHPALRRLSPQQLLLAWYAGTPDCMSLHWCRVRIPQESVA